MCRWIAYVGQPMFLEEFVTAPRQSLVVQSRSAREQRSAVNGDGFGLGWYGDRQVPGLYRDIRPAWSDENLLSLAHQIKSGLFFAHVRASTGTATTRANCHPFSHGRWMFMHNGLVPGWDRLRRRVEMLVPDDLFGCRHGTTDSEVLFLLMVANGLDEDPETAFRKTVLQIEELVREAGEVGALRLTAALSDGGRVYAVRYATSGQPETLYTRPRMGGAGRLLVSEPLDDGRDDWEPIPPQSFVVLERDGWQRKDFAFA